MTGRTFYFSEFIRFLQKRSHILLYAGAICFFTFFFCALFFTKPNYLAESTFRELQNREIETQSLQSLLKSMWNVHEEVSAISIMQSKTLLGKVIEEMGLQMQEAHQNTPFLVLQRQLHIHGKKIPFLFRNVSYDKEEITTLFIRPLTHETYELWDKKKKMRTQGKLHEPLGLEGISFTLVQMPAQKKEVAFHLLPKRAALANLQKKLQIKTNRKDDSLILLKVRADKRENAMGILNSLMHQYQRYLKRSHEELSIEQICYLEKRRDQLSADFAKTLDQHVAYLQKSLGADGFLGLSQELEMLSEPKEKYTAQKHEIDLEMDKWKQAPLLQASTHHPWKEGFERQEELNWQAMQILSTPISTEELAEIDLKTTQKLHAKYAEELDRLTSQKNQLEDFQEKILHPEFELGVLSQVLTDTTCESIIKKASEMALQLADMENRSEKERTRLQNTLVTHKTFLREHLVKKAQFLEGESVQIKQKIASLKQHALELLKQEKGSVEQKLSEMGKKMQDFPEKWRHETLLKLKKELTLQILEGLTQLFESKNLNQHLFHVQSGPLDPADAPLESEPPHLFLYASVGGILGIFFCSVGLLLFACIKGFPLSVEYLRSQKFQVVKSKQELFQRLALEMQPGEVVAVIGADFTKELKKFLYKSKITLSDEQILSCSQPAYTPEAHHALLHCDRFLLKVQDEKAEDLVPFEGKKGLCLLTE